MARGSRVPEEAVPAAAGDASLLPDAGGHRGTAVRVLEAATRLFAERGFHGTSMRDIGAAVGVKAASLYEHFASKDEILAALTTMGHEHLRAELRNAMVAVGDDPSAQLAEFVRTSVIVQCRWPELAKVANDDLRSLPADLAARPVEARDDVGLLLVDIVQRGIDEGTFARRDLVLVVASVGSIVIRTPYWFTPTPDQPVADFADRYAELVVEMVTGPGAP